MSKKYWAISLFLSFFVMSCASNSTTTSEQDNPQLYGSVQMSVESGKATSKDSHVGVKNF